MPLGKTSFTKLDYIKMFTFSSYWCT